MGLLELFFVDLCFGFVWVCWFAWCLVCLFGGFVVWFVWFGLRLVGVFGDGFDFVVFGFMFVDGLRLQCVF